MRAHLYRPLLDEEGNLLVGAEVTINESHVSVPLDQPIYGSAEAGEPLPNPMTVETGILDIWLDRPQRINVVVNAPGLAATSAFFDVHPPAHEVMRTQTPLRITNAPQTGYVLVGSETEGEARWSPFTMPAGLTPVTTVLAESFASGANPAGWTIQNFGPVGTVTYVSDDLPPGEGFTRALRFAQDAGLASAASDVIFTSPPFTLSERGEFEFWAKYEASDEMRYVELVGADGITPVERWNFTRQSLSGGWYRYGTELETSTYRLRILYRLAHTSTYVAPGQMFWVTGFRVVQGGQVPPHDHAGTAVESVALGTGAQVTGNDGVAVGDGAQAATQAVSVGASATSVADGVAVGYGATVPVNPSYSGGAVAVGMSARAQAMSVAVGNDALAQPYQAVAIGGQARADHFDAVAVGYQAISSGDRSIAIGAFSQVNAADGVAVGHSASVATAHTASVAIGPSAVTTAPYQVMLGTSSHVVVVPGHLRALGNASVGVAGSQVGFFGSVGALRPTLANPGTGNATLLALMEYLHDLGLINLTGAT